MQVPVRLPRGILFCHNRVGGEESPGVFCIKSNKQKAVGKGPTALIYLQALMAAVKAVTMCSNVNCGSDSDSCGT